MHQKKKNLFISLSEFLHSRNEEKQRRFFKDETGKGYFKGSFTVQIKVSEQDCPVAILMDIRIPNCTLVRNLVMSVLWIACCNLLCCKLTGCVWEDRDFFTV